MNETDSLILDLHNEDDASSSDVIIIDNTDREDKMHEIDQMLSNLTTSEKTTSNVVKCLKKPQELGSFVSSSKEVSKVTNVLRNTFFILLMDIFQYFTAKNTTLALKQVVPFGVYGIINIPESQLVVLQKYNQTLSYCARLQQNILHHSHSKDNLFKHNQQQYQAWNDKRKEMLKVIHKRSKDSTTLPHMLLNSLLHVHQEEHRCNEELFMLGKFGVDMLHENHLTTSQECIEPYHRYMLQLSDSCNKVVDTFHNNNIVIQNEKKDILGSDPHIQRQRFYDLWSECLTQLNTWFTKYTLDDLDLSVHGDMDKRIQFVLTKLESLEWTDSMNTETNTSDVVKNVAQQKVTAAVRDIAEAEGALNEVLLNKFRSSEPDRQKMSEELESRENELARDLFDSKSRQRDAETLLMEAEVDIETKTRNVLVQQQHLFEQECQVWIDRIKKIQIVFQTNHKIQHEQIESFVRLEYGLQEECRQSLVVLEMLVAEKLLKETEDVLIEQNAILQIQLKPNETKQEQLQATLVQLSMNKEQYVKQLSILDPELTYSVFNLNSLEYNLQKMRESNLLIFSLSKLSMYLHKLMNILDQFHSSYLN